MKFSIIIVNYNGVSYTKKCVSSIYKSNIEDFEVIVVDNGSNDDSPKILNKFFSKKDNFKLVTLDKNYGPAKARNEGVLKSKGTILGFLDNDTEVEKNWAINADKVLNSNKKIGIVQCKLLLSKERKKIDYVGEYIGQNGFLVQRAPGGIVDKGQFDEDVEILAAKSAGMFIKRVTFKKAGGFDEDYFIYVEETDLGWRSWLAGYKAVFCAASIVYHEFGTSTIILGKSKNNYNAKFHGTKNYILTLLKNLELISFLKIVPIHVSLWLGLSFFSLLRGEFLVCYWIIKGIVWNIINIGNTLSKRKTIQRMRCISDSKLFDIVMVKKPLLYFVNKVIKKEKIGNAEGFIKSK